MKNHQNMPEEAIFFWSICACIHCRSRSITGLLFSW